MKHSILYRILCILLFLFVSYSCGITSNGRFEKRKHLKGWYFHKKKNISIGSSDAKNESKYFSKKNIKISAFKFEQSKNENSSKQEYNELSIQIDSSQNLTSLMQSISADNLKRDLSENSKVFKESTYESRVKNPDRLTINSSETLTSENQNNIPISGEKERKSNWDLSWIFILSFLLPLFFKGKKTREIQYWAAGNKLKSQSLLVGLKVGAVGTAIGLGYMVQAPFSPSYLLASAAGIGLSFGLWEYWKSQNELTSTKKLTLMSAVNTSTTFGFFTLGGMFSNSFDFSNWTLSRGILDLEPTIMKNSANGETFFTISSIVVVSILLLILLYLILILSCRIYCGGAEVFALLLAISLGYLIISLYIAFVLKSTVKEEKENSWYFRRAFLLGIGGLVLYALASIFLFDYPEVSF